MGPRRAALFVAFALVVSPVLAACREGSSPPCVGAACAPACPRDSAQDAAGRCTCVPGTVQVLGACVQPPIADAYCGRAARMTADGCVFRSCGRSEALDLTSGSCVAQSGLAGFASVLRAGACPEGASAVVTGGRLACLDVDTTCPRGTRLSPAPSAAKPVCLRPAQCPPGTLPDGPAAAPVCRPIVSLGPGGRRLVDIGAWAALVLGVDGGPGTDDLCRPLRQRPDVLSPAAAAQPSAERAAKNAERDEDEDEDEDSDAGGEGGSDGPPQPRDAGVTGAVELLIWLTAPDQDMARIHARVEPVERGGGASRSRPSSPAASRLATEAVESLLEPLRGLGGEANAAEAKVEVRCAPIASKPR